MPKPPNRKPEGALVPQPAAAVPALAPAGRFRKYTDQKDETPQQRFARVIEHWKKGKMETTVKAYEWDLKHFREFLEVPTDIHVVMMLVTDQARANEMVRDYIEHLQKKGSQPATIARYVSCLRSLAKSARELGIGVADVVAKAPSARKYKDTSGPCEEAIIGIFTHYEMMIRKVVNEDAKLTLLRDYAIVRLMATSGLRRKEVLSLDTEHVDWHNEMVLILGKGRYEREPVKVTSASMRALRNWVDAREKKMGKSGPLFVGFNRAEYGLRLGKSSVNGIFEKLELVLFGEDPEKGYQLAPHRFRHYAITAVAKKKDNPFDVTGFARHSKMETSMLYIDNLKQRGQAMAQVVEDELEAKVAEEMKKEEEK